MKQASFQGGGGGGGGGGVNCGVTRGVVCVCDVCDVCAVCVLCVLRGVTRGVYVCVW